MANQKIKQIKVNNVNYDIEPANTQVVSELAIDSSPSVSSENLVTSGGVYSAIQDVREVAEGKSKNYVIDSQSNITGTKAADGSYTNVTAITGVTMSELKIGDNVLIKQVNVPDLWVSAKTAQNVATLSILETAKAVVSGADRGLSIVNSNVGHSNSAITASVTPTLLRVAYDQYGHITSTAAHGLATVATSGSYNDLNNRPTKVSDFTNDAGYITKDVNTLTYYYTKTEVDDLTHLATTAEIEAIVL